MNRIPLPLPVFGELFKLLVGTSKYNMTEVCNLAGIDPQHPSRWRKGDGRLPDYLQVAKISIIFEEPVEYLIFGLPKDKPHQSKYAHLYKAARRKAKEKNKIKLA